MLRCLSFGKPIDSWFCVLFRFLFETTGMLIFYYLPEFNKLIHGEDVVFEPKIHKILIVLLPLYLTMIYALYSDVKDFIKKKETSKINGV